MGKFLRVFHQRADGKSQQSFLNVSQIRVITTVECWREMAQSRIVVEMIGDDDESSRRFFTVSTTELKALLDV